MKKNRVLSLALAMILLLPMFTALAATAVAADPLPYFGGMITIDQSSPRVGDTLTVTLSGNVTEYPESELNYQWLYSDAHNGAYYGIEGATGKTYTVERSYEGKFIRLRIMDKETSTPIYSQYVEIQRLPYFDGMITIDQSSPRFGDTLTVTLSGNVTEYPESELEYQWLYSDAYNGAYYGIEGATGKTYTVEKIYEGKFIRLRIMDKETGTPIYSQYVEVLEDHTLRGTVTVSPSNPVPGTTLTFSLSGAVAFIPRRDLNYQWQIKTSGRTFANIRQATGSTYTIPDSTADGTQYRLKVTATGYTGTLYSNTVTVGGSSFEKGDVDQNGSVSNSDLILVARHVVNLITLTGEQFTLGDMNDDGVITNTDIITLARKIVGLT
jgi:hypothetical protein